MLAENNQDTQTGPFKQFWLTWPGWCRSGREEKAALQAHIDYGPRWCFVRRVAWHVLDHAW